jgi:hypothetical protein
MTGRKIFLYEKIDSCFCIQEKGWFVYDITHRVKLYVYCITGVNHCPIIIIVFIFFLVCLLCNKTPDHTCKTDWPDYVLKLC